MAFLNTLTIQHYLYNLTVSYATLYNKINYISTINHYNKENILKHSIISLLFILSLTASSSFASTSECVETDVMDASSGNCMSALHHSD